MREKILIISIIALTVLFSGCSEIVDVPGQSTDIIETNAIVFDTAAFDIDNDGVIEECSLSSGPTSGLFTVVITASANGIIKYKNTFCLSDAAELKFDKKDGIRQIIIKKTDFFSGKTAYEYHKLYVEDKRIVIDGLDPEYDYYWGDSEWNYDMK